MPNANNRKPRLRTRKGKSSSGAKQVRGNNMASRRPVTTNTVQNGLRSQGGSKMPLSVIGKDFLDVGYARCRLDPFNAGPSLGLPDADATNRLVFDHRSVTDFSVTGTASILILPALPITACIKPDSVTAGNIIVNGASVVQASSATQTVNWVPMGLIRDLMVAPNQYLDPQVAGAHPISQRCRLIGMAWRIVPLSPSTEINGLIETVVSELSVSEQAVNTGIVGFTDQNDTNGATWPVGSIWTARVNMPAAERYQNTTSKTVQMRPETSPQGVLKHTGPYNFKAIPEQPIVPVPAETQAKAFFSVLGGVINPAIWYWDSGFNVTRIRITAPRSCSYRLETMACVEYVPNPGTPFSRVSMPRPKTNTPTVEIVDRAIADSPAATTQPHANSIINRVLDIATKAARGARALPGPYGVIAGAVSEITDALNRTL